MARNQEKAMLLLNRFYAAKQEEGKKKERRPYLATECDNVKEAERWRIQIIREISKKVSQIQNPGLGEFRIRDLNDEINKLLREKRHWEDRILELGGPNFAKFGPKMLDHEGKAVPGNRGYKYFGAARDLPGVRELFQKQPQKAPRKTRSELARFVDADYYGYRDEEDGIILPLEQEQEKKAIADAERRWREMKEQGKLEEEQEEEEEDIYSVAKMTERFGQQSQTSKKKMATQAPPVVADVTALKKVREDLTCMVCTELFTTPKTLPCLHTFCEKCLRAAEKARKKMTKIEDASTCGEGVVMCPVCRAVTSIDKGVEGIVTNFTYVSLVEHIKIRDKVVSDDELRCGKCKEDVAEAIAVAFCYDCGTALCEFCHQMHKRTKDLAKHSFCTLEEIKESKQVDMPPVKHTHFCSKHPGEELKLYCITCSEVICRDCTITARDHRDHSYDFIARVIESEKAEIQHHLDPLKEVLHRVTDVSSEVEERTQQMEIIQTERKEKIDKAIEKSREILKSRQKYLESEASRVFEAKSKNLQIQQEELELAKNSIASAIDFATTTLQKGSDVEVLMYKKELIARSNTLCQLQASLPLEVTEEDNIHFICDSEHLKTVGKLCEAPCAKTSTTDGPGFESPMQGEETTVTVLAHNSKGQPLMNGGGNCSAKLVCIPSLTKVPQSIGAKVTDNDDGTYTVSYTPCYPGPTELKVKFDNTEIKGSPYKFDVMRNYAHPTPEPYVFTIPNASPWGLTMVGDTELAISGSDCLVRIYSIEGKELHIIKSNFTRPYGITTDDQGCLWITDREAHNVQKFRRSDSSWEKVFQFGTRGVNAGQFSHPRGIAVHPTTGYVYISDMKNNRIQVFKPDSPVPKYHAQFGSPGKSPGLFNLPAGICFDRMGRLIVCDDHNCRLQVFDAEGKFLYTLGTTSGQKGLLCSPIGICSDKYGRYIVTEFGSHCVSFLSPEGHILNCIRTIGEGHGQFVHPRGVTVDSVGYVYIADNENMRIVRF